MKKAIILFITLLLSSIIEVKANEIVSFSKCIDGDTAKFNINNEVVKVRFIAIDTPELAYNDNDDDELYARQAADFTCEKIKNAKEIILEYENNKVDKFNRTLAWIWIDGELLQKELIKKGYAKVAYLYDNYKYTNILQLEEQIAKKSNLGIWKDNISIYKVIFKYDDNEKIEEVIENDKANAFIPTKKGYNFVCWNYNGKPFNFDTPINENIILNAEFKKNNNMYIFIIIGIILISSILSIMPIKGRKKHGK